MRSATAIIAAALVCAPVFAQAPQKKVEVPIPPGSTYRCVDKDGRKYFSATIPQQCFGQVVEIVSPAGVVVKRIDPAAEERERHAKAAAEAASQADQEAKKQRELANKDIERRHQAILA